MLKTKNTDKNRVNEQNTTHTPYIKRKMTLERIS